MSGRQIEKGMKQGGAGRLGAMLLSTALLAMPATAQVVPEAVAPATPTGPATGPAMGPVVSQVVSPGAPAPTGTVADPLRVYGDDAPVFSVLDFLGGMGLQVIAQAGVEYTDNVARRAQQSIGPGGRYRSRDDWIFRPQVTARIGRPLGRQQLFVVGTVGRDIYARNSRLNRNRFGVNGGVNWALGTRCGGQLGGGYSKRGTQLGMFEEVIPSTQESWNMRVGGTCRSARGTSINLNYNRFGTTNHTDDPLGLRDRSWANVKGQGANGGIGYPVGSRGQIGVSGNWRQQEFPNQVLPTGEANGNSIWGANAYASYRLGQMLQVNGSVGKSWVDPNAPFTPSFSGLSWNLGLSYAGPRLGVSASTGRNVNGSSGSLYNYTVGNFQNVSASYQMNEKLSFSAGASFSDLGYYGFGLLPESTLVRASKNQRYFIGADYRLNRILSFSLDYNHNRRTSDPNQFNYRVNTVGLTARATF